MTTSWSPRKAPTTRTTPTTISTTTETERLVGLALGANLGEPAAILRTALERLEQILGPLTVASFYRTAPVSKITQADFLNTAAIASSSTAPEELLELVLGIETDLGRRRTVPGGPRTIDIDLLFVGQLERRLERLVLPHPELRNRRFVLEPLAEIGPEIALPPDGATPRRLLALLPPGPRVERLAPAPSSMCR